MSGKVLPPDKVKKFTRILTTPGKRGAEKPGEILPRVELEPPPGIREVDLSRLSLTQHREDISQIPENGKTQESVIVEQPAKGIIDLPTFPGPVMPKIDK